MRKGTEAAAFFSPSLKDHTVSSITIEGIGMS
jgi:hypothetical protein